MGRVETPHLSGRRSRAGGEEESDAVDLHEREAPLGAHHVGRELRAARRGICSIVEDPDANRCFGGTGSDRCRLCSLCRLLRRRCGCRSCGGLCLLLLPLLLRAFGTLGQRHPVIFDEVDEALLASAGLEARVDGGALCALCVELQGWVPFDLCRLVLMLRRVHLDDGNARIRGIVDCKLLVLWGQGLAVTAPRRVELHKDVLLALQDYLVKALTRDGEHGILLGGELAGLPALDKVLH
mmetsp:Transcript_67845/g.214636  ORF Transcript_67845/g.214636 Transcript_67845/m.214636 type:complete len:239 (-) Transcript_67845:354-1070(-)